MTKTMRSGRIKIIVIMTKMNGNPMVKRLMNKDKRSRKRPKSLE